MVIETFGESTSARETQHAQWRYAGVHPSAYHHLDYDALVFMQKFEPRRRVSFDSPQLPHFAEASDLRQHCGPQ